MLNLIRFTLMLLIAGSWLAYGTTFERIEFREFRVMFLKPDSIYVPAENREGEKIMLEMKGYVLGGISERIETKTLFPERPPASEQDVLSTICSKRELLHEQEHYFTAFTLHQYIADITKAITSNCFEDVDEVAKQVGVLHYSLGIRKADRITHIYYEGLGFRGPSYHEVLGYRDSSYAGMTKGLLACP